LFCRLWLCTSQPVPLLRIVSGRNFLIPNPWRTLRRILRGCIACVWNDCIELWSYHHRSCSVLFLSVFVLFHFVWTWCKTPTLNRGGCGRGVIFIRRSCLLTASSSWIRLRPVDYRERPFHLFFSHCILTTPVFNVNRVFGRNGPAF